MATASPEDGAVSRRQFILGGALLATAGIALWRMPRTVAAMVDPKTIEKIVPLKIGSWVYETKSGLVLPPPDQLSAQLYDQVLTRVYTSVSELPIMLLIAYGSSQDGMLQVHRPETCYPASGYNLTETQTITLPLASGGEVPARFFSAVGRDRTEQLIYWTRIGQHFPSSWARQRLAVMEDNLHGLIPDGVLVRMSVASNDPVASRAALEKFASALVQQSPTKGRAMLIGGDRPA